MNAGNFTILVIEDNPGDRELIRRMLGRNGITEVASAVRLSAALELLKQKPFSAILLDLNLPDSTGMDTLRGLLEEVPEAPIIVLTGHDDEQLAIDMIASGAQDYLVKGHIDSNLLLKSISYSIERKRISVERDKLFEWLRESSRLSNSLNDLNQVIHSSLEVETILQKIVREAAENLPVCASSIGLFKNEAFTIRYVHNLPSDLVGVPLAKEKARGVFYAARMRDVIAFNDVPSDKRMNTELWSKLGITSALIAPLIAKNQPIGALSFYCVKNPPFVFENRHIDFARKLAASLALGMENAGLFSEVKKAQERAAFYAGMLDNSSQPFAAGRPDGSFITINRAFAELTGYSAEELKRMTWADDLTPPEWREYETSVLKELQRTGEPQLYQKEYIRKDGARSPVEIKVHLVRDKAGKPDYYYSFVTDISERKRTERAIRQSEAQFREAFDNAPIGMKLTDMKGRFLHVNRAYTEIVGYSGEELKRVDFDYKRLTHPDDLHHNLELYGRLVKGDVPFFSLEKRYLRKDGGTVWVRVTSSLRRNSNGSPFQVIGIVEDITDRKRLEEEIRHMAYHDALTGLPNRRLFREVALLEIAEARRHNTSLGVFYMDLDRFKEVNDTLGHEIGDLLLKEAALRLKDAIRTSDTIARIGGDEFNLLITDIGHAEYASDVARKILTAFRRPFMIKGNELNVSTSIGISIFPDDSEKIDELLQYADIAMYHAKKNGRNNFHFYSPVINTRSRERIVFENDLRRAIERDELRLYFQPVVDIKTKSIISAEALLRWHHPVRGLLLPSEFFNAAEDIGLMPEIEDWVLSSVSRQVQSWREQRVALPCITVNVSARQFQDPGFLERVSVMVGKTGLVRACLDLEITETTAMQSVENSIQKIEDLRSLGVAVSIDDFGTGYSSLNHLKRLQVQKLKIDRSFIRELATSSDDRKIVSAVLLLAHSMDLKVVAEGVENERQLWLLRALKCDQAQGNYFSKPMPAEAIRELVLS